MKRFLIGLILSFSTCMAVAAIENPVDAMNNLNNVVQKDIGSQSVSLKTSPNKLFNIIKQNVLPQVDVNQMAGITLGPKWRAATPAEKQAFIDAFGLTLTKVFANSLAQAANYKITLYPMRSNKWETAQKVTVNGTVSSPQSTQPSHITYYLERSGDSWKIYDFAVEGVSVVKNYQAQFQAYPDMSSLLARLDQLNNQQARS